ncbi:hypothetical protein JW851_03580 [Candidatus Woesearchaeota archaeon]|nr:hypothetical protein [Candidatus Woesearchaeota archaeon]
MKKITNSRQNNYDKTYLLSKSSEKDDAKLCYGKKTGVKNKRRLGNMKYCLMSDDEDYEEEDYQEDEDY